MLPVIWHPEAELDLLEIVLYIAERSPKAAHKLGNLLRESVDYLPNHPYLYEESDRVQGCREIVVHPNYLVFYEVLDTHISIIKVAHARQEYP
jgi:toxin ParE1/3/4